MEYSFSASEQVSTTSRPAGSKAVRGVASVAKGMLATVFFLNGAAALQAQTEKAEGAPPAEKKESPVASGPAYYQSFIRLGDGDSATKAIVEGLRKSGVKGAQSVLSVIASPEPARLDFTLQCEDLLVEMAKNDREVLDVLLQQLRRKDAGKGWLQRVPSLLVRIGREAVPPAFAAYYDAMDRKDPSARHFEEVLISFGSAKHIPLDDVSGPLFAKMAAPEEAGNKFAIAWGSDAERAAYILMWSDRGFDQLQQKGLDLPRPLPSHVLKGLRRGLERAGKDFVLETDKGKATIDRWERFFDAAAERPGLQPEAEELRRLFRKNLPDFWKKKLGVLD